jgi:predicted pyridoxine 5'-phosphate oxidase superfamily flavin-nucleotide-binding protein
MGTRYEAMSTDHQAFIDAQQMFFVATAATNGNVNLSPKGMDSLRVLGPNRVVWLNSTGSGNETAAHLLENPRMTLMFCAFEGKPLILRLYGTARAIHPRDSDWYAFCALLPEVAGARQIFEMQVNTVQTSCGMAVPFMDFKAEREELSDHWKKLDAVGLEDYWRRKNTVSIDGKETRIFETGSSK